MSSPSITRINRIRCKALRTPWIKLQNTNNYKKIGKSASLQARMYLKYQFHKYKFRLNQHLLHQNALVSSKYCRSRDKSYQSDDEQMFFRDILGEKEENIVDRDLRFSFLSYLQNVHDDP